MWKQLGSLAAMLVMTAGCSSPGSPPAATEPSTTRQVPSSASAEQLTISSTLDGRRSLPHRIHWQATPSRADVSEVDFLVDGKQLWVEHNAPYDYGDDGNYLVTSFLEPGRHTFTVRAIGFDGQSAKDTVTASVPVPPAPPAALAGTWTARSRQFSATLVIDSEGWYFGPDPLSTLGPDNGGNRMDVAYLSPRLLEIRTGMATGDDTVAGKPFDNDLNGWCNNAPGSPARYRWSVHGATLSMTFAGGRPCSGFTKIMTTPWTRASTS